MLESVIEETIPLLSVTGVEREFGRRDPVRALAGVDLAVHRGRSVGIAGESGSGKSTLLKLLLGLDRPTGGQVMVEGTELGELDASGRRAYRSRVQAVFQDPSGSFNPRMRMGTIITEPLAQFRRYRRDERLDVARELLQSVDLPVGFVDRFPHELSGGQKQRVAIARALACDPEVVLLDEPVTALDISVRGAILNLLKEKGRQTGVTYVVVSHDLSAIFHLTEHLYVMRRGIVVESGPTVELVTRPVHPYTQRLVNAIGDPLAGFRDGDPDTAQDGGEASATEGPLVEVGHGHLARV